MNSSEACFLASGALRVLGRIFSPWICSGGAPAALQGGMHSRQDTHLRSHTLSQSLHHLLSSLVKLLIVLSKSSMAWDTAGHPGADLTVRLAALEEALFGTRPDRLLLRNSLGGPDASAAADAPIDTAAASARTTGCRRTPRGVRDTCRRRDHCRKLTQHSLDWNWVSHLNAKKRALSALGGEQGARGLDYRAGSACWSYLIPSFWTSQACTTCCSCWLTPSWRVEKDNRHGRPTRLAPAACADASYWSPPSWWCTGKPAPRTNFRPGASRRDQILTPAPRCTRTHTASRLFLRSMHPFVNVPRVFVCVEGNALGGLSARALPPPCAHNQCRLLVVSCYQKECGI